jgi:LDH2 family malate/lactate/ureidoglycolate dehydrogenase
MTARQQQRKERALLERFHVPHDIEVRVKYDDLRSTVTGIFLKMGLSNADAAQAADGLVYADVRGIETHGVSNMLRRYVEGYNKGSINPRPNVKVIRESASAASVDCDRGLGLHVGPWCMRLAIEKAKKTGMGAVSATNGRHYGAAAFHAQLALEHDMIGLSMTVGGNIVAPTFGGRAMIGLNPIAVAVPANREAPFIFDASMSGVAGNKVALAKRLGVKLAPGWVAEPDGTPIMQEVTPRDGLLMLPLGGTREGGSHKGYSLALMVDILASLLAGGQPGFLSRGTASHHFIAYNIESFTDVAGFKEQMDIYLKGLRECPPAPGHKRVYYAGLPEQEEEIDRRKHGIPLHPEVIEWFRSVTSELGIPWTLTRN